MDGIRKKNTVQVEKSINHFFYTVGFINIIAFNRAVFKKVKRSLAGFVTDCASEIRPVAFFENLCLSDGRETADENQ